jgi:6-phosphogluconolactonase (cycloisomerase 2 family)
MLGHKPEYTPHGLHKYEWNPVERRLEEAWVNNEVSSPNSVPFVAQASDLVYTCGSRDGMWTIEAVNWEHWRDGFSTTCWADRSSTRSVPVSPIDEDGRFLYGTMYGKVRILRGER